MVRDSKKLELATYYRKQGYSYSEIAQICGVSKSTVSAWLAKKAFSKSVKLDNQIKAGKANAKRLGLLNKSKSKERSKRYAEALKTSNTEYRHYLANPLFVAGLMLYLASGDKSNKSTIRISTSNLDSHRIFIKFATTYLGISKSEIKFWLLLNNKHIENQSLSHWLKGLKLSKDQCYKTQITVSNTVRSPLHYGTGNTIIGSTVLKLKLMRWLELAVKGL